jgi:hypothetical protein
VIRLRLEILPAAQKALWDDLGPQVPKWFVLYGGTAVALRFGHRRSIDFDFFTDRPLNEAELGSLMPALSEATVLLKAANTLVVSLSAREGPVKVSFFGALQFGRVGTPQKPRNRPAVASPIDLLATKLKTLHDRVEAKDYLDIEVLLRQGGLSLDEGIAAAQALFGRSLNPLDTAKALGWFKDGNLEQVLPETTRSFLTQASSGFDPAVRSLSIKSTALALPSQSRS